MVFPGTFSKWPCGITYGTVHLGQNVTKAELYIIDHLYKGFKKKEILVRTEEAWNFFFIIICFVYFRF